jgi:hypothetical protein
MANIRRKGMRRGLARTIGLVLGVSAFCPALAQGAAGPVAPLVVVADTRGLKGWEAWFANLYNESHLYFTLLTVIAIPLIGLILGLIADFLMNRIGLDLKSRELAEH